MDDLAKLTEEISNFFEDIMYDWGGSPLLGRIYALCVLRLPEVSLLQKDLVEQFNVNPSTISRNLKELENWRLIDRRREPGSREWKYQIKQSSFLELLVHKFEENDRTVDERSDVLIRMRKRWQKKLSDDAKQSSQGKHALLMMDNLIEWIEIVKEELNEFIKSLNKRYLDLEKKFEM